MCGLVLVRTGRDKINSLDIGSRSIGCEVVGRRERIRPDVDRWITIVELHSLAVKQVCNGRDGIKGRSQFRLRSWG